MNSATMDPDIQSQSQLQSSPPSPLSPLSPKNHATMHIVNFRKILGCDGDFSNEVHINKIIKKIRSRTRGVITHGDMILDVSDESFGYRSCGLWFYSIHNGIIPQDISYDDYGTPPIEFKLLIDFPPGYWSLSLYKGASTYRLPTWAIDHCGYYDNRAIDVFPYWHGGASWSRICLPDFEKFGLTLVNTSSMLNTSSMVNTSSMLNTHYIVNIRNTRYLISVVDLKYNFQYVCAYPEYSLSSVESLRIAELQKIPMENIVLVMGA